MMKAVWTAGVLSVALAGPGASQSAEELATATFAGGCFWCVEEAFDKVDGVVETTSGYANGNNPQAPSYEQVSRGGTGYVESLRVKYDPDKVGYDTLLDVFWKNHDPTDLGGQFCDRGDQYRPAIFYETPRQEKLAEASKEKLAETKPFEGPVLTPIEPLKVFHPAEDYHQDYHDKNPVRYQFYKYGCGRAARLAKLWGEK
jgi:peptide-methionine (S)-S-oxide reductase